MAEPYVFLSYASLDAARAARIAERLEGAGIRVWFDRAAIAGGATWSGEIVRAIQGCAALLVLCSPASMASANVQRELQLAMEDGRPLLPLLLEPARQPPEVRYILAGRQSIALLDRPEVEWLPQVLQALGRLGIPIAGDGTTLAPESVARSGTPLSLSPRAPHRLLQHRLTFGLAAAAVLLFGLLGIGMVISLHTRGAKSSPAIAGGSTQKSGAPKLTVYAGTGEAGHVNGPTPLAQFSAPQGLDILADVSLLIGDNGNARIRRVSAGGSVTDFCGSGVEGYADGACSSAQFSRTLQGVTRGPDGTIYVADGGNLRIRAISPAGVVSTVAGSGVKGFADGEGAAAQFGSIARLAVDTRSGALYTADYLNSRIRKITPSGSVTTFAGSGTPGYVDGPAAVAQFNQPHNLAVDAKGNVYVADVGNRRIRKITPEGAVSTLAGSGVVGFADGVGARAQFGGGTLSITTDPMNGDLYVMDTDNHRIRKITPEGVVSTAFELVDPDQTPFFIALAPSGDLYLTDTMHNRIYKIIGIISR